MDEVKEDSVFQKRILFGLSALGKHVYQGTVEEHVIAERRRKSKAARKARRINRR